MHAKCVNLFFELSDINPSIIFPSSEPINRACLKNSDGVNLRSIPFNVSSSFSLGSGASNSKYEES